MTKRRVTLSRPVEHLDGSESIIDLVVDVIHEPATRWDPEANDVEPVELRIDDVPARLHDHAELVDDMIANESIPEEEAFEL